MTPIHLLSHLRWRLPIENHFLLFVLLLHLLRFLFVFFNWHLSIFLPMDDGTCPSKSKWHLSIYSPIYDGAYPSKPLSSLFIFYIFFLFLSSPLNATSPFSYPWTMAPIHGKQMAPTHLPWHLTTSRWHQSTCRRHQPPIARGPCSTAKAPINIKPEI